MFTGGGICPNTRQSIVSCLIHVGGGLPSTDDAPSSRLLLLLPLLRAGCCEAGAGGRVSVSVIGSTKTNCTGDALAQTANLAQSQPPACLQDCISAELRSNVLTTTVSDEHSRRSLLGRAGRCRPLFWVM